MDFGKESINVNASIKSVDECPAILRVEDLRSFLSIGRNTAYKLVKAGEIRSIKIGRQIRIPRQYFMEFLNQK